MVDHRQEEEEEERLRRLGLVVNLDNDNAG
jgi:hypothetical protein